MLHEIYHVKIHKLVKDSDKVRCVDNSSKRKFCDAVGI